MSTKTNIDIVIIGAGIAGLWAHYVLRSRGYNCLLLESEAIGAGQTLASQGIIHSGLKYAFAGKVNKLAQSISAMPDLWRSALRGEGDVDLSAARMNASSQYLLIPKGFMGGLVKLVTRQALGGNVHEVPHDEWPAEIAGSGFKGSVIFMDEPVLDIESVIRALAQPYQDSIRKIDTPDDVNGFLARNNITARRIIYTAAGSNHMAAIAQDHGAGLKTQKRPLLMGFMHPAPFECYAHLVGRSDKPVATITTHKMSDGTLCWYLGGGVAERDKDANPQDVYKAAIKGFKKYLPHIDLSQAKWSTLPIDRIEGKSEADGWMPDTPTIHSAHDHIYCWPTKLTFAPLLSQRLVEKLEADDIKPSGAQHDFSVLPPAPFADAPWNKTKWESAE